MAQTPGLGAFRRAGPHRFPASPGSAVSIMNVQTSTKTGSSIMASIGPVAGGAGGGPFADDAEAGGANLSFLKNTPVEISEAEIPITIRRYGLVPDSGSSGRYRGAAGWRWNSSSSRRSSMVTARNRDRSVFSAWGLTGGRP